jgi:hypothetical protein
MYQGTCGPPDPPPWSNRRAGNAHIPNVVQLEVKIFFTPPQQIPLATRVLTKGERDEAPEVNGIYYNTLVVDSQGELNYYRVLEQCVMMYSDKNRSF